MFATKKSAEVLRSSGDSAVRRFRNVGLDKMLEKFDRRGVQLSGRFDVARRRETKYPSNT